MWIIYKKQRKNAKIYKETGDSQYIYQNELDKACFQHDMSYGDFKDLTRRTTCDKILSDKAKILLKIQNIIDFQGVMSQWFTNFLIKRL